MFYSLLLDFGCWVYYIRLSEICLNKYSLIQFIKTTQGKFHDKLWNQYLDFLDNLQKMNPDQILDLAYEKVIKEEIVGVFGSEGYLDDEDAQRFLDENTSLDDLFRGWMNLDGGINQVVEDAMRDVAGKIFECEKMELYEYPETYKEEQCRIYKAELADPEIEERVEIFNAANDYDAIKQAYKFCEESEGITLLELHELRRVYTNEKSQQ